jgi:hypothetical protein
LAGAEANVQEILAELMKVFANLQCVRHRTES